MLTRATHVFIFMKSSVLLNF